MESKEVEIGTVEVEAPSQDVALVPAGGVSSLMELVRERPDVSVEVLERLVALQERVTAREAEMAMAEALGAFQADCPAVPRIATAEVKKNGVKQYEYHFAPLDEIVRVIRPHLTTHGLSYTHDSAIVDREVETRCTLQHVLGAIRTATFRGPVDASGGKNPLQGVGSARSYGRRYTLVDVLGLTTEEDNDGAGGGEQSEEITSGQATYLKGLLKSSGADVKKFLAWLEIESVDKMTQADFPRAVKTLEEKEARAK